MKEPDRTRGREIDQEDGQPEGQHAKGDFRAGDPEARPGVIPHARSVGFVFLTGIPANRMPAAGTPGRRRTGCCAAHAARFREYEPVLRRNRTAQTSGADAVGLGEARRMKHRAAFPAPRALRREPDRASADPAVLKDHLHQLSYAGGSAGHPGSHTSSQAVIGKFTMRGAMEGWSDGAMGGRGRGAPALQCPPPLLQHSRTPPLQSSRAPPLLRSARPPPRRAGLRVAFRPRRAGRASRRRRRAWRSGFRRW